MWFRGRPSLDPTRPATEAQTNTRASVPRAHGEAGRGEPTALTPSRAAPPGVRCPFELVRVHVVWRCVSGHGSFVGDRLLVAGRVGGEVSRVPRVVMHEHPYGENDTRRSHPEFVVLDFGGGDVGALIVHTDPDLLATEVGVSPAGDDDRSIQFAVTGTGPCRPRAAR